MECYFTYKYKIIQGVMIGWSLYTCYGFDVNFARQNTVLSFLLFCSNLVSLCSLSTLLEGLLSLITTGSYLLYFIYYYEYIAKLSSRRQLQLN